MGLAWKAGSVSLSQIEVSLSGVMSRFDLLVHFVLIAASTGKIDGAGAKRLKALKKEPSGAR
jgi:hypothetical protein